MTQLIFGNQYKAKGLDFVKEKKIFKNVVLIGSTSDIGLAILKELSYANNAEILLVGRVAPEYFEIGNKKVKTYFHKCDLESFEDLQGLALKLSTLDDINLAIIAAGYLPPENMELDQILVRKSMMINAVGVVSALSSLVDRMHSQDQGHILHLSTVAAMRPRSRNFTYGASKSSADFFARGLSNRYRNSGLTITVLRSGYVFTKMSKGFLPAPFARTISVVVGNALHAIHRGKQVSYSPSILRIVMKALLVIPQKSFNYMDRR